MPISATSSPSAWLPLASSMLGGTLVWVGQYFERRYRRREERNKRLQEQQKDLREIYAYLRKLEAVMKNNYRELAMAKSHAEYWWYCQSIETDVTERKEDFARHLESQARARQVESKIGEDKATFIGHVRKFQTIIAIPDSLEAHMNTIADLALAKAESFNSTTDYQTVRFELYEQRESKLREIYFRSLADFKLINDTLQSMVTKAQSTI